MNDRLSKRQKFFLGHLGLSLSLALIILMWVFFCWYPSPLAKAVGVTHIFLMMLAIDVIVGPVLGFIVYKEGKKTLKFDLSVIILITQSCQQTKHCCKTQYFTGKCQPRKSMIRR